MLTDLTMVRDLMVEAEGIEAAYGPNAYTDYLRAHKKRPPRAEAEAIGKLLGGRVRADDGTMQPKKRPTRKQRRVARELRHPMTIF
jgi:hypothetical protein